MNQSKIEHVHNWRPLGPCDHPLTEGRLGYAFECSECHEREHRWGATIVQMPAPFGWMRQPELTEDERAKAIEEEKARCKVGTA